MAAFSTLKTLIGLAADERDAAATQLGKLHRAQAQSQQQLDALLAYRAEYRRRMATAMAGGLTMASLANYQRFFAGLDEAIEHQRTALANSEQRLSSGKRHWQDRQRRLRSFDVLDQRRRDAAARTEAKREQAAMDEYAGRAYARSRH